MIKGFRSFVLRGNVVDLAVAVVIGAAFATLVTAFTSGLVQPVINALGGPSGYGLGFHLRGGNDATFVNVGAMLTAVVNFLLVAALVYFLVVVPVNALLDRRRRGEEPEPVVLGEDVALLREIRDLIRAQGRP